MIAAASDDMTCAEGAIDDSSGTPFQGRDKQRTIRVAVPRESALDVSTRNPRQIQLR